jgi:adenylylsulfate kinase
MSCKIIWLTGLSGSGKTTLANFLAQKLSRYSHKIKKIDGDYFRKKTNNFNNFSKKNIINNNLSIINYVFKIRKKYNFIIVSVISPLLKTRQFAKKKFKENYFEVYVKCSIKELFKRDTKNLYFKAKKNIIKNLIGYKSKIKYEKSKYKKITIDTEKMKLKDCVNKIHKKII